MKPTNQTPAIPIPSANLVIDYSIDDTIAISKPVKKTKYQDPVNEGDFDFKDVFEEELPSTVASQPSVSLVVKLPVLQTTKN